MSLKTVLVSRIAQTLTSETRLQRRRAAQESQRRAAGAAHVIDYFHDVTDPYSQLVAQILPALAIRYDIRLAPHLTAPPPDWAAPERRQLEAYARADAGHLARRAGLSFDDPGDQPDAGKMQAAAARLAAAIDAGTFVQEAARVGEAYWRGQLDGAPADDPALARRLAEGSNMRGALGHYLGATFHHAGEWYWGIDRLHHLETRLTELGARIPGTGEALVFAPPDVPASRPSPPANRPATELHYYLSFRSPYTYVAAARAKALADAYGAELKLRFVLPMMMRGLPVPRAKRQYIAFDTAREARRLGIPFGRIADPLGKPVERGYSILPWARDQGRGFEFCHAFLTGVWSQGIDAGSNGGLRQIVETAGLDWAGARHQLATDAWRAEAEQNRAEMTSLGVWGVPSFRVGDMITWGQDRLWRVEDELKRQTAMGA